MSGSGFTSNFNLPDVGEDLPKEMPSGSVTSSMPPSMGLDVSGIKLCRITLDDDVVVMEVKEDDAWILRSRYSFRPTLRGSTLISSFIVGLSGSIGGKEGGGGGGGGSGDVSDILGELEKLFDDDGGAKGVFILSANRFIANLLDCSHSL
jgi:hypothetical protein